MSEKEKRTNDGTNRNGHRNVRKYSLFANREYLMKSLKNQQVTLNRKTLSFY